MPETEQAFRPEFTNLVQLLSSTVERFAERPLFGQLQGDDIAWTSYGEFATLVANLRAGLQKLGVKPGDGVAVISNNRLEWAVGAHAAIGLGARYVPMYEAQDPEDWQYILNDADISVVFVANDKVAERFEKIRSAAPNVREVINFEGPESDPKSYRGLLASGAGQAVPPVTPKESDIAILIYTSGTTGQPKGVMLTHYNLASNVSALLSMVAVTDDDCGIAFLPWAHIFGGSIELNLTMVTGGRTVICGDAQQLSTYMAKVKPTILFAVPRVWNKIYDTVTKLFAAHPVFQAALAAKAKQRKSEQPSAAELEALATAEKELFPLVRGAFGGKLRFACSGAAALSREVAEFMETLGIEVYEGYGMTETGGVATSQPYGQIRLGSVGKPLPGIRIELDKSVPGAGADEGEVIVYGSSVMKGYYKKDDASRATLTEDGGLRTGDIGRVDSDGYLFLTGRAKELYKLENGKYVAPVPLEEHVALSPYIAQCVVYGSNRPHNVALIVPDLPAIAAWAKQNGIAVEGEALLSEPQVRALLETEIDKANQEFKGYERIQRFVVESEELSTVNGMLTQTQKLKRKVFNDKYEPSLASLYVQSEEPAPRSSYIRELVPASKVG
jgi:long-chain acyl-CoA synthetase